MGYDVSHMSSHAKSPKRKPRRPRREGVIRRSFALPAELIEQVSEAVPPEYGVNPNAAVRHALEDYLERRKREDFRRKMEEMAADPQIQAINAELNEAFKHTLLDGLPDDPAW